MYDASQPWHRRLPADEVGSPDVGDSAVERDTGRGWGRQPTRRKSVDLHPVWHRLVTGVAVGSCSSRGGSSGGPGFSSSV
jgi:hypothetical protein